MEKSIADLIKEYELWLRLAIFIHGPLKSFLLHVLHNLGDDTSYRGLPKDPKKLYQWFSTRRSQQTINVLNGLGVLNQDQIEKMLPPGSSNETDSSEFDVTLLCILIRNFTTLSPPINGWKDKNPPASDLSIAAFVIRAREWRNFIHHTDPENITDVDFNQKWIEGEMIIDNLGFTYDTTQLKTISLDPQHEIVVKALYEYIGRLEKKQKTNTQDISTLKTQLLAIKDQVKELKKIINLSNLASSGKLNLITYSQLLAEVFKFCS